MFFCNTHNLVPTDLGQSDTFHVVRSTCTESGMTCLIWACFDVILKFRNTSCLTTFSLIQEGIYLWISCSILFPCKNTFWKETFCLLSGTLFCPLSGTLFCPLAVTVNWDITLQCCSELPHITQRRDTANCVKLNWDSRDQQRSKCDAQSDDKFLICRFKL